MSKESGKQKTLELPQDQIPETTEEKEESGDSLEVNLDSNSSQSELEEYSIQERISTLQSRIKFLRDRFDREKLSYDTAFYLAEPGIHDLEVTYHQQPMSSINYPNSKKSKFPMNRDIYQNTHPLKNDPSLFFLKTDVNPANIYTEYYSTKSLYPLCRMRPLVISPKVYLTRKDDVPYILSEFIVSNAEGNYEFSKIPMFPYLAAIMLCKKDRDVNPKNYLLRTEIVIPKGGIENHIPIAVRIDHGSEVNDKSRNPFVAQTRDVKQSAEVLFALTSIFENDLGLEYGDISWQAYNLAKKTNFLPHIKRDEAGLFKIKDELNYILFMRGICDFIEMPKEILDIVYDQDSKSISRQLKNDFITTQQEVAVLFAKEIERFKSMIKEEPWKLLGEEYMASIPFEKILENYHGICAEFSYKNILAPFSEEEIDLPLPSGKPIKSPSSPSFGRKAKELGQTSDKSAGDD